MGRRRNIRLMTWIDILRPTWAHNPRGRRRTCGDSWRIWRYREVRGQFPSPLSTGTTRFFSLLFSQLKLQFCPSVKNPNQFIFIFNF